MFKQIFRFNGSNVKKIRYLKHPYLTEFASIKHTIDERLFLTFIDPKTAIEIQLQKEKVINNYLSGNNKYLN